MPRDPIVTRDMLYDFLPDGSLHLLDWNIVTVTPSGSITQSTMIEPRNLNSIELNQLDVVDASFTRLTQMTDEDLFHKYLHGGQQQTGDFRLAL